MKGKNARKGFCMFLTAVCLLTGCTGTSVSKNDEGNTLGIAPNVQGEVLSITGMANLFHQAPSKDSQFWKEMEKKFNVEYTVDWVPIHTYQQKVELVLASGELPDLMQIQNTSLPSYVKAVEAGAFYDLTELLGYYGGMAISSKCSEEKVKQILKFFDATCAKENYNFVNFGIEGVHWDLKDGNPVLTELGAKSE